MAHFVLEYSANLEHDSLALDLLFKKLHQAAANTKLFPLAGIRSRAHCCEHYRIANGNPEFGFVHLQFKLGTGRTEREKRIAAKAVFDTLSAHLQPLYEQQGLAISFEMTELPVTLKYNQNNLHTYLAKAQQNVQNKT